MRSKSWLWKSAAAAMQNTARAAAAILVCLLMTAAFVGEVLDAEPVKSVALLFIAALFSYTGALMCLLREVFLAIGSFRLGIHPSHLAAKKTPGGDS